MELLGYILTLLMGVSLGLLGGGGSILTVPILLYVFDLGAVEATAYSLFIVGLAAGFGALGKYREGLIHFRVGVTFATPGFLGVFLARAYLIPAIPQQLAEVAGFALTKDSLIMLIFAIMMILASVSMIRGRKDSAAPAQKPMNLPLIAAEGLVVGLLTGFVGAGGGFLIIPALVILAHLPMKTAVGTSLMIISFKSLLGFTGDILSNPDMDWTFLLTLAAISIGGIYVGSHLSQFVSEGKLKKAFGYFVLIMGTFILAQQLAN